MPASVPHSQPKLIKATVTGIVAVAENIRIVRLHPAQKLSWLPGQYLNIGFGGLAPRAYSIASAPGSGSIEIHVKRGKGEASGYVMNRLAEGEEVFVSEPQGDNVYRENMRGPILALAGGLGIAPVKAIAEAALGNGFAQPFILYWGTAEPGEEYLNDLFKELADAHGNFTFHPVSGYPVTDVISRDFDDLGAYQIYVSGPPAMIAAAVPLLREKGANPGKISYDRHPEAANLKS